MLSTKVSAACGSWKSPISSDLIVSNMVRLGKVCLDQDEVFWLETRPEEDGRDMVSSCLRNGTITDLTPRQYNVRTRVHEFGGGSYTAIDGKVFFSNLQDQRIYKQSRNEDGSYSSPVPLTPEPQETGRHQRFADITYDPKRKRVLAVQEDHRLTDKDPPASIVAIDENGAISTLVDGDDFYICPKLSTDGKRLAWISWNHPGMPWYGSQLWLAELSEDGTVTEKKQIAGGPDESILQPEWSPNGILYFVSDKTGWWNIYRQNSDSSLEQVMKADVECGVPHLYFGHSTYGFACENRIICSFAEKGIWQLAELDTISGKLMKIPSKYNEITFLKVNEKRAVFRGGAPDEPISIIEYDLLNKTFSTIKPSFELPEPVTKAVQASLSIPETIEFASLNGRTSHAFFYPPNNEHFMPRDGELPPLLVKIHGGPHNQAFNTLDLTTQYFTSRGFAVVDVNYGGSSGFGRKYRQSLRDNWGVVDNEDGAKAAQYLAERGDVDPKRMIISGMSAGGYATMCSVAFHKVFSAGSAHFGISDMEAMAELFHKFQSRFLSTMIGKFPQERETYRKRSAINHVEQIKCPLIIFHGALDSIVPISQSERLVEKLDSAGKVFAYLSFEDEPHVFRKAHNVKKTMEAELSFFAQVFGFETADALPIVDIKHWTGVYSVAPQS